MSCNENKSFSIQKLLKETPRIIGKKNKLNTPFVTAGNRVYMVGQQDGSFPEIGWHIEGEMSGIWDHPIKLMDGFDAHLKFENEEFELNKSTSFTNFPFANLHQFELKPKNINVERWQFVPDNKEGILIQFVFSNNKTEKQTFQFEFIGYTDLRTTWLGEKADMNDGKDEAHFNEEAQVWEVKDSLNNWFNVFGLNRNTKRHSFKNSKYKGKGVATSLVSEITIEPNDSEIVNVIISGSYNSKQEALETFNEIQKNYLELLTEKRNRYEEIANQSKLTVPNKKTQEVFEWIKYNSDWLVRTVPEFGTGIMAGIPDYPWWFGVDSEYALQGYMAIGQHKIVQETIKLIDSISNKVNDNGRIIHEVSSNGVVFNKGNINETPQFTSLIWNVYQWTGDKDFLKKFYPTIKKGLNWLLEENDHNKNLLPEGYGIMEIQGLNSEMIDVASYTYKAFADASKIARELELVLEAETYSKKAIEIKNRINREFWSEDFNSYADFLGKDNESMLLIEEAIKRAEKFNNQWAVDNLNKTKRYLKNNPSKERRPSVLFHNWIVNIPLELKIADSVNAIKALETASKFTNDYGVYVTGIDKNETEERTKHFSYVGAVMTLPTGILAIAENNYGRPNKALKYIEKIDKSFSYALPGSIYEVSPDYGMMTQAWTTYAYVIPIVHQFFGIKPNAAKKEVIISPLMPDKWNEASLENVRIVDDKISIFYKKKNDIVSLKILHNNPEWKMIVEPLNNEKIHFDIQIIND
jgi:glycogen debranching enzyme